MKVSSGPLEGYLIEGTLAPGSIVKVVKPDGDSYVVRIKEDSTAICNCMASRFKGRCKHADYISSICPKSQRYPRTEVEPLVKEILDKLAPAYEKAEVAGSWRRGRLDVKDIDILLVGNPTKVLELIQPIATDIKVSGNKIIRFHFGPKKIMMDLTFTEKASWGAALLYRTGSVDFNIKCRGTAKRRGWKLNEYGLWDAEGKLIEAETEEDILWYLDIPWTEPKDR